MSNAVTPAGEPETSELPGICFPALAELVERRTKYLRSSEEASALEAKLARLELDESEVLNDIGADEETQCKRLAEVRIRKDVQARRTSHKRLEVTRMLAAFEEAYPAAELELSAAQTLELSRRKEILVERVVEALGLPSDHTLEMELNLLIGRSPLIRVIQDCEPRNYGHLIRCTAGFANFVMYRVGPSIQTITCRP